MTKTIFKGALLAVVSVGLLAGGAFASPWTDAEVGTNLDNIDLDAATNTTGYSWNSSDYWTLSDLTTGVSGSSRVEIEFERASYNSDFGFYSVNDVLNPTAITTEFKIFDATDEADAVKNVYFQETGGIWQISADLGTTWTNFSSTFGFYYQVDKDNDGDYEYKWYTDNQFNYDIDNQTYVDNLIEHVVVAYQAAPIGTGGSAFVFLDDQIGGGDRDWRDMDVSVSDVAPVPEPATMLLFGTGLAGLAGLRRKKGQKKA